MSQKMDHEISAVIIHLALAMEKLGVFIRNAEITPLDSEKPYWLHALDRLDEVIEEIRNG